jgi:hypothetical protein
MKPPTTKSQNVLYVLHYKGQLMGTYKWSSFSPDGLYGWRPPKKIYFTMGTAKCGISHLPKEIIPDVTIVEYVPRA